MQKPPSKPTLTSQDFVMSQLNSSDMPSDLFSLPHISKLDHLIIKNFKSFKQETFTGPFLKFTSIIGPNGSGKSNVLDALMFCLCGQNLKHNFFQLREYINREKAESYKDMSKKKKICSVTAIFTLEGGRKMELKRELDPDNNETFYINKDVMEKKVYQNLLFKQGINPHIPNYAITQGQIDKLLMKEPLDLSKYIENLSGSFLYKRDYDSVKNQISQIRKTLMTLGDRISKIKKEKKNSKIITNANKQYEKLQQEYQQIVNNIFLGNALLKQLQLEEMEKAIQKKKIEEKQKIDEINKKKLSIQEELKHKHDLNKEINLTERTIMQLNSQLKAFNTPDLFLKTKNLENSEKELQYMQTQFQKMMDKKEKLQQSLPQIHSNDIISEYLGLYSQWQAKNREINMELQKKKNNYFMIESQRQFQQSLLEQELEKEKKQKDEEGKRRQDIESSKQQISQIDLIIQKIQKEIKEKEHMLKKNESLLRDLKEKYEKVLNEVQNLEELLTQNIENTKDKEIVKRLSLVEGFRGIVEQKIRPKQQKQIVAFSILTSAISKYLLCKDEASSNEISNKLKNMNTIKNLVILGNVKKPNGADSIKENLGKAGIPAIEIIDLDANLEGLNFFLQTYCRGKVVCEDLSSAFEIRNKKIPGLREIITLDGEVIKNDGTIASCGNAEHVKRTFKLGSNKKSVEAELQKATKERDELKVKIAQLEKQCKPEEQIKRNDEIIKLTRKKGDIQQKIQFLSSIKPKQNKSYKTIEKEIGMLAQSLAKIQKEIKTIEKGISKDKQMAEFMKKHNIQDIESFRSASNLNVLQKQFKRRNQIQREIYDINGNLEAIKGKIDVRAIKVNSLKSDLTFVAEGKNKSAIEKEIEENQKKAQEFRSKASQLGVYRDSDLQLFSEVVEMETRFKFMRQKSKESIEDLKIKLGASIDSPRVNNDWKTFEEYVSQGSLSELSRRKIENAIRDLETEKQLFEQKLQKLNTMGLLFNKDSRQQVDFNVQLKELNDDVASNTTRKTQLEKKFDQIKAQRIKVFMIFFDKLKMILRQAYEALTETQSGVAGKAELYLENSELPFEDGIYYTPTPPAKRMIYDLDQLSGGQKSIASLALQYSLAVCSKSPFLILDESDAYLDANNASKLLKLLAIASKDKMIQIILVTHKPSMFENCDSLVGVCRPKDQFSKVFSHKIK